LPSYLLIFRYFGVPETRFSQLFQWTAGPYLFFGIGLICYLSYFLILTAYSMGGEVAAVTAVRQASIPISVLLGGLMFREGSIVRRFGASCLLVLGILIIVTG